MAKTRFEMLIDDEERVRWYEAARADGRSLAAWLRRVANEAATLEADTRADEAAAAHPLSNAKLKRLHEKGKAELPSDPPWSEDEVESERRHAARDRQIVEHVKLSDMPPVPKPKRKLPLCTNCARKGAPACADCCKAAGLKF